MSRARVTAVMLLLAAGLGLPGCALLRGPDAASKAGEAPAPVAILPEAPAEYDLLVAQQLTFDGRTAEAVDAYLRAVAKDPGSAYLQRKAAIALAQHGRLDEALLYAQRAVDLEPADEPSRLFLGQLYRLRRETEAAEKVLRDEKGEPLGADAAFLLYQLYLDAERFDDALASARWIIEHEPDSLRGLLALANVYQRMDRPDDAERAYREALEQDPGNLRIYGALARQLRMRGAHEAEEKLYREILQQYPNHHATLVALGEAQIALDDLEGAIVTFEAVVSRHPDDVESAQRLGFLFFEERRYPEAGAQFERVIAARPTEYDVAFFLAVVRRRNGNPGGAIEAFDSIPLHHQYYPEARAQIASIHERRGDYKLALQEVQQAQALRPSRELDLYAATLQAKAGEFDQAVARMQAMLLENPDDDELLFNLGVLYGEAERTEEALDYMRQALAKNPDNASALNYIGYTWAERGENLDEAERMIVRAIELRPEDGFIVDSLGWVYYMRARPLVDDGRHHAARPFLDRALSELERADELTGGDPVISEHMGDIYLLLDQKHRALEMFEEAVRQEPREAEQPKLRQKLEMLQQELR